MPLLDTPPLVLLGLLALPLALLVIRSRRGIPFSRRGPGARLRQGSGGWKTRLWWLPEALILASLPLWAWLLAGPGRSLDAPGHDKDGLSIALVLDRSGSMGARVPRGDGLVTRLEGVKSLVRNFLEKRPDDRFTLVSFARFPETHTPLTDNHRILGDFLEYITLPTRPEEDGTAIGDAVILALGRLEGGGTPEGEAAPGVVILLTDGQNNAGTESPARAAELAREQKVPVYTIGLGGEGLLMVEGPDGTVARRARVDLDEDTLRGLAKGTGGAYFRADSLDELEPMLEKIARMETRRRVVKGPDLRELDIQWGIRILLVLAVLALVIRNPVLGRVDP